MSNGLIMILIGIFCIAAIVTICLLAKMDNIVGRIFRGWWNISFKIAAHIPFCGWMAHFIIADTDRERAAKRGYIQTGKQSDQIAGQYIGSQAFARTYYCQTTGGYFDYVSATGSNSAVLRSRNSYATVNVTLYSTSGDAIDDSGLIYTPAE